jgi:hypothetical protein
MKGKIDEDCKIGRGRRLGRGTEERKIREQEKEDRLNEGNWSERRVDGKGEEGKEKKDEERR